MRKKYFRLFTYFFSGALLLLIFANFGINFWLKKNLPNYLNRNKNYQITYQKLNIDLLSGNISANSLSIENKAPGDLDKLGLQGTIDSLKISRLGIYDALFNKEFSTKNLKLIHPE